MSARRTTRGLLASAEIFLGLTLSASLAFGQRALVLETSLTLIGAVIVFPTPTVQDYEQGFVNSTNGVTFTVNATKGNQSHTTAISIRSTTTTLGGGKPLNHLQWRRSDLSEWTALSIADIQVELRIQTRNGLNDPWTNTIFFRILLDWAQDPPATYFADYQITLSQTAP
jgi:hypothetical protein